MTRLFHSAALIPPFHEVTPLIPTNLTETNPQSLHCSSARKAVCAVNQQLVTDGDP